MPTHSFLSRILRTAAAAAVLAAGSGGIARAQTTLVLSAPGTQVTDSVTIRAGASANQNFNTLDSVATQAGAAVGDVRRGLLKFDTQSTLPAGTAIQSAIMTLTVKSGGADASRTIGVYPVTASFVQAEATWNVRRTATPWTSAGGDLGAKATQASVSNAAAATVKFDVTGLVRQAVSGATSSRYTRIALADLGASSAGSLREFYSIRAADPSVRPVLTIVYGAAAPSPVAPSPSSTPVALRVLQYNTHHGGWGSDGVYDPNRIVNWIVKANPDLVSLNEIEVGTSWSKGQNGASLYKSLLEQRTGRTWYAIFYEHDGVATGNGNLVLSKLPFVATATRLLTDHRCAVDVTVAVNGRNINFTSVHLDNVAAANRLTEIAELLAWEGTLANPRLVLGDFNAWPTTAEIANMDATYLDTWPAAQALGTAVGNGITHGAHRIDYVFLSKGTSFLTLKSTQIYDTADANGVMPSDHQPVLAVFDVQ